MFNNQISIVILALLVISGCSTNPRVIKSADTNQKGQIQRFENTLAIKLFNSAFDDLVALQPEFQTRLGVSKNNDKWNPVSHNSAMAHLRVQNEHWARIKSSLNYDLLDSDNQLNYQLMEKRVADANVDIDYWYHAYRFDQMNGAHARIPAFLINIHPARNKDDLENYIKRLTGIKPLLTELIGIAQDQEARGIMPPQFSYPYVIDDSENIISGRPFSKTGVNSPLLEDFLAKVSEVELSQTEKDTLVAAAEEALLTSVKPAYEELLAYLAAAGKRATADVGSWKLPQGDAYYSLRLNRYTTTDLSPEEIHQIGLSEVNRIQDEMKVIMDTIGFNGTLSEFFKHLRDDPRFYFSSDEAGKQQYLDKATGYISEMANFMPQLFKTLPESDLVVKAVEPFREKSAGKAFYSRPAPDGSRPGIFYVNLFNMSDMPTWEIEGLSYHEGIPGHHLQLSIATELKDVPKFRKFNGYTAYSEGWGLYMEYIPREYGFYKDPYSDFGRLSLELWRAARLVVDTGIHFKRWNREQAIDYLVENTPNPTNQAVKAIERYIVMPGQATAYKIGMLKILELRNLSRERLGDQFDIRDFHDLILRTGSLPLSLLETLVLSTLETSNGSQTSD